MDDFDASMSLWKVLGELFSPMAPAASVVDKMQKRTEAARDPYVKAARAARDSAENTSFITPEYLAGLGPSVQADWDLAAQAQSEHEDFVEKSQEKAKKSREKANSNLDYYMNMQDPLSSLPLDASNYLGAFGSSPDFSIEPLLSPPSASSSESSSGKSNGSVVDARGYEGTPDMSGARKESMSALNGVTQEEADKLTKAMLNASDYFSLGERVDPSIYTRGYENSDFDINAPKMSALNGVTQEEADKLTMEMGLPFTPFFGLPNGPTGSSSESGEAATNPSEAQYIPHSATTMYDEVYDVLANNPELAEKWAEFADKDNYGWTRARASHNSDFWADMALADPRIMQRYANVGIDVDDLEHLSSNIYDWMYDPSRVISFYNYATDGKGYLGDSKNDVEDAIGFLNQMSNYGFAPDYANQYQLDLQDAIMQAIIRNAYAGGGKEYDLDTITELARNAGYLTDDESFSWGSANDSWWVDNNDKRASLPQYVSLGNTQYLNPASGQYDSNAALSFADAMSLAEEQIKDKNGNPSTRRLVVKNSKSPSNSSTIDKAAANDALANLGY